MNTALGAVSRSHTVYTLRTLENVMSVMKAAELWHSGQTSYLYSVLSTGRFYNREYAEGCLGELEDALAFTKGNNPHLEEGYFNEYDCDEAMLEEAIYEVNQWLEDNPEAA